MQAYRFTQEVKKRIICQVLDLKIDSAGKGFLPWSSSEKADSLSG